MSYNFKQWWRIIRITDHEGNDRNKFSFLLNDNFYAYGLHFEHSASKRDIFCWETVEIGGDFCDCDDFTTSSVENIKETEQQIIVTTKNSVYYFEKVEPPQLPKKTSTEKIVDQQHFDSNQNKENESVNVVPSEFGKLLILRTNQQKYSHFKNVRDIQASLSLKRRYTLKTDYSIVDLIRSSDNPDICIQKISEWLTSRTTVLREAAGKLPETELYLSFFTYTLHLLSKGEVLSYGIDDVIKMGEALQESDSLYVNTFILCMANTEYNDMILDVENWLGSEPIIPRDFVKYVLAAVATFVGSLPDPILAPKINDEFE